MWGNVGDTVRALLDLPRHEVAFGEVFNIGGGQEITIMDLARLVRDRTGSVSEIVTLPYDQAYAPGFEDMQRRVPDLGKAFELVGYRPRRNLDDIIRSVIGYFAA
jgi:UDP-glucose 4-epimerase